MKRIEAACLLQTVHFQLKEDTERDLAQRLVQTEYEQYKAQLQRSRTRHTIVGEETLPDGSIRIKIRKQYNSYPVGDYLE
ncbi:MAG: hypothetical protein E7463_02910 [Ruminococcaceae bacterium]|nr:hypothetical protein [Oscillospiraceae bacterium]